MQKRKLIRIAAALIIAVAVTMIAKSMMNPPASTGQEAAKPEPASQVLGAARDLPIGTLLKDSDVKWIAWPAVAQSTNLYVKGTADKSVVLGSVLRHGMRADEPLLSSQVVNPKSQGFLAAVLNPGMRAVAIKVNPDAQVAGFVFPGDRVDVLMSHTINRKDDPQLTDRHVTETVLNNVRVLALDQKVDDQATEAKIAQLATLEVSPQDAERLALAATLGTLSLSLRSLQSEDTLATPPTPSQLPASALLDDRQTWDSDVSKAYPSPGGTDHLLEKVQIMRGKETSEMIFEKQHSK